MSDILYWMGVSDATLLVLFGVFLWAVFLFGTED